MKRLRIDDGLAAKIDKARGLVPRDRWVADTLDRVLGGDEGAGARQGIPDAKVVSGDQGRPSGSKPASKVASRSASGGDGLIPVASPAPLSPSFRDPLRPSPRLSSVDGPIGKKGA